MPECEDDAGHMHKGTEGAKRAVVPRDEAPEVVEPPEGSFDDPASAVAFHVAPVGV